MSHGTHPPCCWSRRDIMADVMFTCVKTQNAFLLDHSKIIHFCRLLEWTHTLCFSCIIANFSAEHTSANRTNRAAHTRDVWRLKRDNRQVTWPRQAAGQFGDIARGCMEAHSNDASYNDVSTWLSTSSASRWSRCLCHVTCVCWSSQRRQRRVRRCCVVVTWTWTDAQSQVARRHWSTVAVQEP